jgi:hypothetical protein
MVKGWGRRLCNDLDSHLLICLTFGISSIGGDFFKREVLAIAREIIILGLD